MFKNLAINNWRQFSEIGIDFHEHLTIITGSNGAGKTTMLNLLSKCTGVASNIVSSYELDEHGAGHYTASTSVLDSDVKTIEIGELSTSGGETCKISVPQNVVAGTYEPIIKAREKGVFIRSHRPVYPYKKLENISTQINSRAMIFDKYFNYHTKFSNDEYSTNRVTILLKETLAGLATFGEGNSSVSKNDEARKMFSQYVEILKLVLPPKIGFRSIKVSVPEVIICTDTGDFPIDASSGGIASLIDITWQLFMFSDPCEEFIAIIDEPENHLHPELQKSFLGNLIKAFPRTQFIVATHNPFMITSQKDSKVYALYYNNNKKVFSKELDYVNKASSANEILREVLGLESTLPLWTEETLNTIVKKYLGQDLTGELFEELRKELDELGLADHLPNSVAQIMESSL